MCSSLLGLGGTHVQQCSECRISRICVPYSRSFKRNSIAASYQHHAGLQPANLVTDTTVTCSRRSDLLFGSVRLFFTSFLQFIQYFVFFRPFTTELQYGLPTSVTYRTRYFRTWTYCTYMFMPDFYARFTVRPWRQLRTVRDTLNSTRCT